MTTLNPFDLLGDDAEDPSQIVLSLPKKIEKPAAAAPVQPAKAAKLPTKPLPPSQAVRESRNGPSGGRVGGGGGAGRGGPPRGSFNPGGNRPHDPKDGPKDGERNGGFRGYRESGGRGGHIGGFANGKTGDVERPKRVFDRRNATGRSNDLKREGGGRGNWGTPEDDVQPATDGPTAEVEKSPVADKEGGEDATTDSKKEAPEVEQEPEDKEMTLEEYEKILEEKKKALQATRVEERKVDTKVFESMQQLSNKKTNDEEIFIKLGSDKDKRKDAAVDKEDKAKKSLSINEFLKQANGENFNPRGGYRGRGGRGSGRGQRDGKANGGGNPRNGGGVPAPAIGDSDQFPSLGK
ncbi:Hyaluronan / mRNA binding family [Raphanus sativus]|uniref:RGG repeats nuclear RNA binding protein C-like n=1 Tax=Raphanus sativus TaxID=3726 RepID=A0A6J0KXW9_RAPSA|nr:RGG repeats nuclear RNA binding protein C-like [Raphanus sativus]KAJ4878063.1 Hyaluronan / mRNA binding family [Raphanus sativus]